VYYDARQNEIYVSDLGNNRIVLFDSQGGYKWEFSDPDHLNSAMQLVVDSLGRIYGMGVGQEGKVAVFDYDGSFLGDLILKNSAGNIVKHVESLLFDKQERLMVLISEPATLLTYDLSGSLLAEKELFADYSGKDKTLMMLGKPAIVNDQLVIPLPTFQVVARLTLDGTLIDMFGEPGGIERKLSFPIAAAGDDEGNILILDKHRHVLVKYDPNARWVEEFGGFGGEPGHFYHPTVLASASHGECIVAQIFAGRVQKFRVNEEDVPVEPSGTTTNIAVKE